MGTEVAQTRQRLARASEELVRLADARRRAASERNAAELDLLQANAVMNVALGLETVTERRTIHFLYASPAMYFTSAGAPVLLDRLNIEEEFSLLERALAQADGPDLQAALATPKRLLELLTDTSPRLCLHVSCHGTENCLQLEDKIGFMEVLPAERMRALLARAPRCELEVVVLLCCNSEAIGRVLLKAGVRNIVCTRGKLPDRAARFFLARLLGHNGKPRLFSQRLFQPCPRALAGARLRGSMRFGLINVVT